MTTTESPDKISAGRLRRWLLWTLGAFVAIFVIAGFIGAIWIDSDDGHDYIISKVEELEPDDGLRIKIGRINGSILGEAEIVDLELHDPKGLFFQSGSVAIKWSPLSWIFNELNISAAVIAKARLKRIPELVDTGENSPILPEFDVYIGTFRADNLAIGKAVTGEEQFADLTGAIDITAGRAMVNLDAATTRSGDKLMLLFNAEPDEEKLDLKADIIAPAGGVIAGFSGFDRDLVITADGAGDWSKWDGEIKASGATANGKESLAVATLAARDGLFGFDGNLASALLPSGLAQKLGASPLSFEGSTTVEDGLVNLDLFARSEAAMLTANGGIDLRDNMLDAMRIEARVLNPALLVSNMKAQDLEAKILLNGKFSELRYQYLLTAPQLAFGKTLLSGVRADGKGQRDASGWDIPTTIVVKDVIGNGELAKRLASGFGAKGYLRFEPDHLFANKVVFKTESLTGTIDIDARPSLGDYAINIGAQASGFLVQGVGLADILAQIKLVPGPTGLVLTGQADANLRRLDNGFFNELGGGLPELETGLAMDADGYFRFTNLKIKAPKLSFNGSGVQRTGAIFAFNGRGNHSQYGEFDLGLEGPLNKPEIALVLDSPLPAAGLSQVRLYLSPVGNGFSYTAAGGSTLGPFDSDGMIVTGKNTLIQIDRLLVTDTLASGVIRPTKRGLAGTLNVSGGGVNGNVMFEPAANRQIIRTKLVANNARFDGNPPIIIRTGALDADIILIDDRSNINATVRAQGISRGNLIVGRVAGNAKLTNGTGTATFSVAGTRGSTFEFQVRANITPGRYILSGNGLFEGKRLMLDRPLELSRVDGGWNAARTTLSYGSGSARISGRWAVGASNLNLNMSKMPLSLVDIIYDDLGLGGLAYGTVNITQRGSQTPVGDAKLTIKGLTRSGLILTSTPVDLGLNVAISSRNAAARGVIKSRTGKPIGRFQGRVTGLGGGNWKNELFRNPLFAEARFNGSAESLWRLTGVETFDLTGPIAVDADVGGTLANPEIRGQFRTSNARLESGLTGTVITGIKADGRFDGSRLLLPNITGLTKGGGSVSGRGDFNFAVEPGVGVGINLSVQAKNAALIARDDFAATITGPIKITNSSQGGLISGKVVLNRSFFKFGNASTSVALPQIKTREINRRADERPRRIRGKPWRYAISADVPNRLRVEGLGLDSEWRAKLRLAGPVDDFAMTGSADLLRGNYTFAGRRFKLDKGVIRFVGDQPPNPILDIEAEANLTGLNTTINVTGRGNRPEIAFNSVPALPEDELLSRVLFGDSIANLSAPEAVQLAAAVASLNSGGGLDPINQLRKAVGLDRLRFLSSDTSGGQGTSIAAGKYITRRAYVELITDGKGYSATQLEFQITRWLSVLSTISTLGRQSANVRISRDY